MNKKILVMAVIAAFGIGGASTIAYQTHAQQTVNPVAASVVASQAVVPTLENTKTDSDNIQNDKGLVDQPDAVDNSEQLDKETNDDKATSTLQADASQEKEAGSASDLNEKEDAN